MILLNVDLDSILFFSLIAVFGPAAALAFIGVIVSKISPKTAKVLYILAIIYLIIAGGICGMLLGVG